MTWRRSRLPAALLSLSLALVAPAITACGKKGPPLPPLVRIPSPPADASASRRGQAVDIQFTLPNANTDGSKPANIQRVDVYALSGAAVLSDNEVMRSGTRIGSVDVKAPRDPNQAVDQDDPDADVEALNGPGLDQGAVAHVRELLTQTVLGTGEGVRTYVAIGMTTRGRRGTMSKAVAVSLGAAPAAPAAPAITYSEQEITVKWPAAPADAGDVAYHVYHVAPPPPAPTPGTSSRPGAAGTAKPTPTPGPPGDRRISEAPITETQFVDKRIAWNVERCYTIRAVRRYGELAVEGDPAEKQCVVLKDTFPPAAPTGVTAVATEGSINLIWTPSPEADLAGYRVLRATGPDGEMQPVTPDTIKESTFSDRVQPGARYSYAVQAVDTAGNVSAASVRVEETAR